MILNLPDDRQFANLRENDEMKLGLKNLAGNKVVAVFQFTGIFMPFKV